MTKDNTLASLEQQLSSWQYRDASNISQAELDQLKPGKIAIKIHSDGSWSFKGSAFERLSMVALLAKSLITIDHRYYLIAPEQLLEITVEDLPFSIVSVEATTGKHTAITLTTNLGERFELGKRPSGDSNPSAGDESLLESLQESLEESLDDSVQLESRQVDTNQWDLSALPGEALQIPTLELYRGLRARLSRNCFYQLVDWSEAIEVEGRQAMCVFSNGVAFILGYVD